MAKKYSKRPISSAEYSFLLTQLEEEMMAYEADTRRNSGHNRGGIRILHGDTFNFAKFALECAWRAMEELRLTDVDHHARVISGIEGQYWPVEIAASRYAALNQHTPRQRAEFATGNIDRKSTGKPVQLHNSERSVYNWRRKLTSSETLHHANGATSQGFDLFSEWVGIGPDGQPSEKGRCGVIGFINLKFVLGPQFQAKKAHNVGNQAINEQPENDDTENFSAISLTNKLKKIKVNSIEAENSISEAKPQQPENIKKEEDQRDAKAAVGTDTNFEEKKSEDQEPPRCAAPPEESKKIDRMRAAVELWALLLKMVYNPMIFSRRVRYNSQKSFENTQFTKAVEQKSQEMIYDLLGKYSPEVLQEAIKSQAKWLDADENRWIYTPVTFLSQEMNQGSLVSAIRELVGPDKSSKKRPNTPDELIGLTHNELYDRIQNLGCTTIRKSVFAGWIRKYGYEYVLCAVRELQQGIHIRRQKGGYKVGLEYNAKSGGNSTKLSYMIYWGYTISSTYSTDKMEAFRIKLRKEADTAAWAPYIREVLDMKNNSENPANKEKLSQIYSVAKYNIGYKLENPQELDKTSNAVLFAWAWRDVVKPSLSTQN